MTSATERPILPVSEMLNLAGTFEGVSDWIEVTQYMIDTFADATNDHQFIHVDPEKASQTPFGGTIAHGFLTLSLLSLMASQTIPMARDAVIGINYGFDKIRFLSPVKSGSRIRGVFRLCECDKRNEQELLSRYDVTVEIENSDKPALVAQWYTMVVLGGGDSSSSSPESG